MIQKQEKYGFWLTFQLLDRSRNVLLAQIKKGIQIWKSVLPFIILFANLEQRMATTGKIIKLSYQFHQYLQDMTHLISCYDNISFEMGKLNIGGISSLTFEEHCKIFSIQEFDVVKTKVLACLQKTNLKHFTCDQNILEGELEVCGLYDPLPKFGFDIFLRVKFLFFSSQVAIFSTLLRNGIPIRIINKNQRLMMNKFILKVNSVMKSGSFRINPNNGEMCFCFNTLFGLMQLENMIDKPTTLLSFLEEQFSKGKQTYEEHLLKILEITNNSPIHVPFKPSESPSHPQENYMNVQQSEQVIYNILPIMHLEFPFMYSDSIYTGVKPMTADFARKLLDIIKANKEMKKYFNESIIKIAKSFQEISEQKVDHIFSQEEKRDFATRLLEPYVHYPNGLVPYVYTQIQIQNVVSAWQVIDQGGFGVISKAQVKFVFKDKNQKQLEETDNESQTSRRNFKNTFNRQIVRKQDFQANLSKLTHEKKILSTLKKHSSPFIAKFYFSNQALNKNYLFIEYCSQKSMNAVRSSTHNFMSLYSKLIYLKYVAQGIKFLKDHDIFHLDIKPTNILIGSGIVKLTDFGESFHPQVCQKNFRPGTSLPYAPPESFSGDLINFNSKMDVFSFGVLMFDLLYEGYPFDYSKSQHELFKKAYSLKNYSKLIHLAPEKTVLEGYCKIDYALKFVSLRCLEEEEKKRPCIEWILIILQYCISIEKNIYI